MHTSQQTIRCRTKVKLVKNIINFIVKPGTNSHYFEFDIHLKNKIENNSLKKVRFIKVNEFKITQIELFYFFHFICVVANASEFFCMAYLAKIDSFLCHSNLSF